MLEFQKNRVSPLPGLAAALCVCLGLSLSSCSGPASPSDLPSDSPEQEQQTIALPSTTEDGSLTVQSLFSSSVFNFDGDGELSENVATISYANTSGKFISSAQLRITTDSQEELVFQLADIPADGNGIAFETSSTPCEDSTTIQKMDLDITFESQEELVNSNLSCTVSGTEITVVNLSDSPLSQIRVVCHCTLDGTLFGGSVFEYTLDALAAGECATINASDCIYGDVMVIRASAQG